MEKAQASGYALEGVPGMDIKQLAERARKYFTVKKRPSGEAFWKLAKVHPGWLYRLVFKVHDEGQWLPDDYKYEYIVDALDLLSEGIDPEEGRDQLEPDVYTTDLFKWVSSHLNRQAYADEVLQELKPKTLSDLLMAAQVREKEEVWSQVVAALEERLRDIEAGIPEDFGGSREWSPGA